MEDLSQLYLSIRGTILRSIDDVEMESLDTSTEGENTPTPSPLPMNNNEFESTLIDLIEKQRFVWVFFLELAYCCCIFIIKWNQLIL